MTPCWSLTPGERSPKNSCVFFFKFLTILKLISWISQYQTCLYFESISQYNVSKYLVTIFKKVLFMIFIIFCTLVCSSMESVWSFLGTMANGVVCTVYNDNILLNRKLKPFHMSVIWFCFNNKDRWHYAIRKFHNFDVIVFRKFPDLHFESKYFAVLLFSAHFRVKFAQIYLLSKNFFLTSQDLWMITDWHLWNRNHSVFCYLCVNKK